MNREQTTLALKAKGLELGFSNVGVTSADDFLDYEKELMERSDYGIWTDPDRSKYPGRSYLAAGCRPTQYFPEGKSIICATFGFSRYDYPEVLRRSVARAYLSRSYVPLPYSASGIREAEYIRYLKSMGIGVYEGNNELPQREACARAGIITFGNNNFAYTETDGSFVILYTFLVDARLEYDEPTVENPCPPNCNLCIRACPTQAIVKPKRLNPHRCVIHNNQSTAPIPEALYEGLGTKIHGCDVCQECCPRNREHLRKQREKDPFIEVISQGFELEKVLHMDEGYYDSVIQPIMYNYIAEVNLFRRNAAIAMGNTNDKGHIPALEKALVYDHPDIQKAVHWAIGRLSAI